jgi:ubiquinone/menaquinone biosynthesis C-methylase UbiE
MEKELADHFKVTGLDHSAGMLSQAKNRIIRLVQGNMVALPFKDESFDGLYFMQSLHHVGANLDITLEARTQARKLALKEAIRVLREGTLVIIQRDPAQNQAVWFWKYFPQALETKLKIQPKVSLLVAWLKELGLSDVEAFPVNDPMANRFFDPTAPLNSDFRRSFSDFSYLSDEDVRQGVAKLKQAISDGTVIRIINECKKEFTRIGGTVFTIFAKKRGQI